MTNSARLTEIDGHVAIVTGAAGGIGRATALRLADAGASVVLVDLVAESLDTVADEVTALGSRAVTLVGDVTDRFAPVTLAF